LKNKILPLKENVVSLSRHSVPSKFRYIRIVVVVDVAERGYRLIYRKFFMFVLP